MIGRRRCVATATAVLAAWRTGRATAATQGVFDGLPDVFRQIEAGVGGRLGVAVHDSYGGYVTGYRTAERFPIASTYKLLAAGAVLAATDAGRERLDRHVQLTAADLVAYSPVTELHAGKDGMTVAALCSAAVVQSDNTAGNLLMRLVGGPTGLTAYLRTIGDGVTCLDRIEPVLNEAIPGDVRDTTSPAAMLHDLMALTLGPALSVSAKERLIGWLRASRTGATRLQARLPPGWTAGDRTGTADHGTSNDVGLLWPPNQDPPVLVAAFLTESPADGSSRDGALASVGSAIALAMGRRS